MENLSKEIQQFSATPAKIDLRKLNSSHAKPTLVDSSPSSPTNYLDRIKKQASRPKVNANISPLIPRGSGEHLVKKQNQIIYDSGKNSSIEHIANKRPSVQELLDLSRQNKLLEIVQKAVREVQEAPQLQHKKMFYQDDTTLMSSKKVLQNASKSTGKNKKGFDDADRSNSFLENLQERLMRQSIDEPKIAQAQDYSQLFFQSLPQIKHNFSSRNSVDDSTRHLNNSNLSSRMPVISQNTSKIGQKRANSIPLNQMVSELATLQQQHDTFRESDLARKNASMAQRLGDSKKMQSTSNQFKRSIIQRSSGPLKDLLVQHSAKSKAIQSLATRINDDLLVEEMLQSSTRQTVTKLTFAPHPHAMPKQSKLKTKKSPIVILKSDLNYQKPKDINITPMTKPPEPVFTKPPKQRTQQSTLVQLFQPQEILQDIKLRNQPIIDKEKSLSFDSYGTFNKVFSCPCSAQGYLSKAHIESMTSYKYKEGLSKRLLVAKDALSLARNQLPILIVNLEGVFGYFDHAKTYQVRPSELTQIISLSNNFRVIGYCAGQTKRVIKKLCFLLLKDAKSFTFDAVYQLNPVRKLQTNLTQVFLDFYDERQEMGTFTAQNVVILSPDTMNSYITSVYSMDLREILTIDRAYYKPAKKAPLVIRLKHARLRTTGVIFDSVFFILTQLVIISRKISLQDITRNFKEQMKCFFPKQAKQMEKLIQVHNLMKFVNFTGAYNFGKGFKTLVADFGNKKLEWLAFHQVRFLPPVPLSIKLIKQKQQALKNTDYLFQDKRLNIQCSTEEAQRRFYNFLKANEKVKKHIKTYKAAFWLKHKMEEPAGETSEECKVVEVPKKKEDCYSSDSEYESDASSTDSEVADYDVLYPEMRFRIIQIKCQETTNQKLIQAPKLTFECRPGVRPLLNIVLDLFSKKNIPVCYISTQQEHLIMAQREQIEESVKELEQRLTEPKKLGKEKEQFNYD